MNFDVEMEKIEEDKHVTSIMVAYSDGTITKYKKGLCQVWENPWEEPKKVILEPCEVSNQEIVMLAECLNIAVNKAIASTMLDELRERIMRDGGNFEF